MTLNTKHMKRLTQTERNKIQAELLQIMEQDPQTQEFMAFLDAETKRMSKDWVIEQIKKAIWETSDTYPQQLSDYLD